MNSSKCWSTYVSNDSSMASPLSTRLKLAEHEVVPSIQSIRALKTIGARQLLSTRRRSSPGIDIVQPALGHTHVVEKRTSGRREHQTGHVLLRREDRGLLIDRNKSGVLHDLLRRRGVDLLPLGGIAGGIPVRHHFVDIRVAVVHPVEPLPDLIA